MDICSFHFFVFCIFALAAYVVMPQTKRWIVLLAFSALFYLANAQANTALYLIVSVVSVYCSSLILEKERAKGKERSKLSRFVFWFTCLLNIAMLATLKYSNFIIWNINSIRQLFKLGHKLYSIHIIASLGISYYTLQMIGYLCDCYWNTIEPQKNMFKLLLFGMYFPQMTSGPISRYSELSQSLYSGNVPGYESIVFGMQRALWGLFKKLVVAGRLEIFVTTIYDHPHQYSAFYIWIAAFAFSLQLYSDFSGCMDIIMGVSECFGVILPDNFNAPMFSRTIQEFWQRWHITLGSWFKVYVMYPFLDTRPMRALESGLKSHFGKKPGKRYASYIGMMMVWLGIGIWHGSGWKYIIGEGIWFWLAIVLGKELKPVFDRISEALHVNKQCFSYRLFQSLRTFVVFSIGLLFFRASSLGEAFRLIGLSITMKKITAFQPIVEIGLDSRNWFICAVGLCAMLTIDYLHTRGSVRQMLARQNLPFRWLIMLLLIFAVLLWGQYGPGYDASQFIYAGF